MANSQYSIDYKQRVEMEINHYKQLLKDNLFIPTPTIWGYVEKHFWKTIHSVTGFDQFGEFIANYVKGKTKVSVLGLGSGACGVELEMVGPHLAKYGIEMELTCIDINKEILEQAERYATEKNVKFKQIAMDVNEIQIDANQYDVIVAYAALHHFVELDHIAKQINKGLKPDGLFVTVDIPTRNGYLMWEETHEIVNGIWKSLPAKYKVAHTGYAEPTFVEVYPNVDYSINSFECINSEAILPALNNNLKELYYVPALSISRRFFDTMFGPNYNIDEPLDRKIFDYITSIDQYYIDSGLLKPETFFGAYSKKQ